MGRKEGAFALQATRDAGGYDVGKARRETFLRRVERGARGTLWGSGGEAEAERPGSRSEAEGT